jgi:hypothetical protein
VSTYATVTVTGTVDPSWLGLALHPTGLSVVTGLNNQTGTIVQIQGQNITFGPVSTSPVGTTADSGTANVGQIITVDSNNNAELIHQTGGYPTIPITGTPSQVNQVTESVQVIETTSLNVIGGTGSGASSTIAGAGSIAPYTGLVLQFASTPPSPVIARFKYFYLCRFPEDTLEFDNFMATLWSCQSFKFEQVRI